MTLQLGIFNLIFVSNLLFSPRDNISVKLHLNYVSCIYTVKNKTFLITSRDYTKVSLNMNRKLLFHLRENLVKSANKFLTVYRISFNTFIALIL